MGKIRINEYNLKDPRVCRKYNIISLADLHSNTKFLKLYSKLLDDITPNFICVSGDTFDFTNDKRNDLVLSYLKMMSNYYKVYISLGNHDFISNEKNGIEYTDNPLIIKRIKNETYCNLLDKTFENISYDEVIDINGISMRYGFYLNHEDNKEFDKFTSSIQDDIDEDKFNILMCHSPNSLIRDDMIIDHLDIINKMNLILCGHNHGGLMPRSFQKLFHNHIGLVGAYYEFFTKTGYGYWTDENSSLLLTDGVTKLAKSSTSNVLLKFMKFLLDSVYIPDIELIHLEGGNHHSLKLISSQIVRI